MKATDLFLGLEWGAILLVIQTAIMWMTLLQVQYILKRFQGDGADSKILSSLVALLHFVNAYFKACIWTLIPLLIIVGCRFLYTMHT